MIEFKNVTIAYDKKIILKNISFNIKKQEKVFLIGKSGEGKSTLLSSLLNPKLILSGNVIVNGQNIKQIRKRELSKTRKNLGILFQHTNLLEEESVYENIKIFYPKYANFFYDWIKFLNKKQKTEIWQTLKHVGILSKIFTRTAELSGGEKRRLEIVLIMLKRTPIILADEPTSSLDITNSTNIIKIFMKNQSALLISVHKLNLIPSLEQRVIALRKHKIVFDGPFKNIDPKLKKVIYD